jgi:hypothetical protein
MTAAGISKQQIICCLQQATLAAYYVDWRIAKQTKPHTLLGKTSETGSC